jgi:hypothetical protein
MANLLIGSSNVNRFYKAADFPNVRKYKMVKCTQTEGFTAYMDSLDKDVDSVLISVLENFVVDAVGADVVGPEVSIDKCIKDFLTTILSAALRLPRARFGVVMPLRRPALPWYQDRVATITKFVNEGLRAMVSDKNINNVSGIECIPEASQQFDTDLIHLTKSSGKIFVESILERADKLFDAPLVDLTEAGELVNDDQIKLLEDRLQRLENSMRAQMDKNVGNDLMFARSREETDAITNKSKEDRMVLNGLKSATPLPADSRLKIEALKTLAAGIFESLIPGFTGKIVYLTLGKSQGQPIPMVEIRMENPEQALLIRKAYADKKKSKSLGRDLDTLFVAKCVSLATRVRVDVMKAIARRLTNKDDLAYVAGFTSRPMMHIRKAGPPSPTNRPLKSFSYIDSVTKFGHLVSVEDLETAYGRAGKSFNGQLQQNFVILNERDQTQLQSVVGSGSRSGYPAPFTGAGGSGRGGARGGGSDRSRGQKRPGENLESRNTKK